MKKPKISPFKTELTNYVNSNWMKHYILAGNSKETIILKLTNLKSIMLDDAERLYKHAMITMEGIDKNNNTRTFAAYIDISFMPGKKTYNINSKKYKVYEAKNFKDAENIGNNILKTYQVNTFQLSSDIFVI